MIKLSVLQLDITILNMYLTPKYVRQKLIELQEVKKNPLLYLRLQHLSAAIAR